MNMVQLAGTHGERERADRTGASWIGERRVGGL